MSYPGKATETFVTESTLSTALVAPAISLNETSMHIIVVQYGQMVVVCPDNWIAHHDLPADDQTGDEGHEDHRTVGHTFGIYDINVGRLLKRQRLFDPRDANDWQKIPGNMHNGRPTVCLSSSLVYGNAAQFMTVNT